MHSYLGVACKLLQFAATQQAGMVRAFCRPHAYTFNEQSKMATALTPLTNVTTEKSHVTDGDPETVVSASLQKIKSIKNVLKHLFSFFSFIKSETSDSFANHFDSHFAYLKTLDFSFNIQEALYLHHYQQQ